MVSLRFKRQERLQYCAGDVFWFVVTLGKKREREREGGGLFQRVGVDGEVLEPARCRECE